MVRIATDISAEVLRTVRKLLGMIQGTRGGAIVILPAKQKHLGKCVHTIQDGNKPVQIIAN